MLPSFGKLYKLQEINSNALGNVVGSTVRITGRYGVWHHIHKFTCMLLLMMFVTRTLSLQSALPQFIKKNILLFFSESLSVSVTER